MKRMRKYPDMLEEYDFSMGTQGKYAKRYEEGTNVVVIDPDVAVDGGICGFYYVFGVATGFGLLDAFGKPSPQLTFVIRQCHERVAVAYLHLTLAT